MADALMALWRVRDQGILLYADGSHSPAEMVASVRADAHRAACLLGAGLRSFGLAFTGMAGPARLEAARRQAGERARQVKRAARRTRRRAGG
jgi:hypothetical protein